MHLELSKTRQIELKASQLDAIGRSFPLRSKLCRFLPPDKEPLASPAINPASHLSHQSGPYRLQNSTTMQISTITTLSLLLTPCITSPLQRSSAIRWTPHDWLDRNRGLWQFDSSCIVFKSLTKVVENLVTLGPSWDFHWSLNRERAKNSHVRPLTGRTEKQSLQKIFVKSLYCSE